MLLATAIAFSEGGEEVRLGLELAALDLEHLDAEAVEHLLKLGPLEKVYRSSR